MTEHAPRQRIVCVVGRSNSGKTTLVESLIRHFAARGLKVSALKSMRHDFEIDHEGKDSRRYVRAGARSSGITNGRRLGLVYEETAENPLEIVRRFMADSDVVFIEGYKEGDLDKIEVFGDSPEGMLVDSGISRIRMVVSVRVMDTDLPQFRRDDIEGIAAAIEELF